jgi:hypothetical protein
MIKKFLTAGILAMVMAAPGQADSVVEAAEDLCETLKTCALKQMGTADVTPELRQMMEPMLQGMCAGLNAKIGDVPAGHPLQEPAVACMRSMEKLGCAMMENKGDVDTPECKKYEELASQYESE